MQDLEARLIRIERVVENQSLVELSNELERLRGETTALRGELETLRFESENSASRQRELYVDVDERLRALEAAPRGGFEPPASATTPPFGAPATGATGASGGTVAPPRPTGSDQQNYQAAFDQISARKYEEAGRAFETFLVQSPTSPLADNAQYWLGETHYVRGQFNEALLAFRKVLEASAVREAARRAAQGRLLPDRARRRNAARTSLQEVMRQFPDTTAARLASTASRCRAGLSVAAAAEHEPAAGAADLRSS
jgi:tol-pal system protein YbgF